ncbi:MAG TPA: hypothetical protein VHY08_05085 [Bacillota bacterium]|nr:hypothetical protein [Bacillota bacterium]
MKRFRENIPYFMAMVVVLLMMLVITGVQSMATVQTVTVLSPGVGINNPVIIPIGLQPTPPGNVICPWDPEGG